MQRPAENPQAVAEQLLGVSETCSPEWNEQLISAFMTCWKD
jgi:hypothetical protein